MIYNKSAYTRAKVNRENQDVFSFAIGGFFNNIFGRKEGGSKVGNWFRGNNGDNSWFKNNFGGGKSANVGIDISGNNSTVSGYDKGGNSNRVGFDWASDDKSSKSGGGFFSNILGKKDKIETTYDYGYHSNPNQMARVGSMGSIRPSECPPCNCN